jgi:hypothetical protein
MSTKSTSNPESSSDSHEAVPPHTETKRRRTKEGQGLPEELAELVMELRETVRRLDPRHHTPRTLRRALSPIGDILADIDRVTAPRP